MELMMYLYLLLDNLLDIVDEIKGLDALFLKIQMEFFDFLKNTIF